MARELFAGTIDLAPHRGDAVVDAHLERAARSEDHRGDGSGRIEEADRDAVLLRGAVVEQRRETRVFALERYAPRTSQLARVDVDRAARIDCDDLGAGAEVFD